MVSILLKVPVIQAPCIYSVIDWSCDITTAATLLSNSTLTPFVHASCVYNSKLILKTYQLINVVNGVNHSHKTANIFFSFDSVA